MKTINKITLRRNKFLRSLDLIKPFIKSVISLLKFARLVTIFKDSHWDSWVSLIIKELDNKGIRNTINLFKDLQRVGIQISLGIEIDVSIKRKIVKGTIGIPELLLPILPLLQGNLFDKRIGLTLLNLYKLLRLPPDPDYSAITLPSKVEPDEGFYEEFTSFIYGFPATSALVGAATFNRDQLYSYFGYMPSSHGPNGPSLKTIHRDLFALLNNPKLLESVEKLLNITNPIVYESLQGMKELVKDIPIDQIDPYSLHSRVSQLCEGGGKTRNIAIIDYFSQNALAKIHDVLMEKVKKIRNDATYSQDDGFKNVILIANTEGCCYSFDLSSATDRLPLRLQKIVITKIFGKEIGDLWADVIANRDFCTPQGGVIRWAVGQPLGALSSWVTFSITHHLIIRFCAGTPYFNKYVILGDDVAIMSHQVAERYVEIMGILGVEINMKKGFISKDKPVYGEFAKRIFKGNEEITGIPVDLMISCRQSLYNIPDFLNYLKSRWNLSLPGFELYAPESFPFLSKKGKELLSIILTFRSTLESGIAGFPWCILGARDLFERVRSAYLLKFQDRISTFFDEGSKKRNEIIQKFLIDPVKENEGDHVSNMVLQSMQMSLHPVSLIAIKTMNRLSDAQEDIIINLKELDKYLVEYLPDPQLKSYVYDRKTVRNMTIGKTALEFYYEDLKKISNPQP